MPKSVGFRSSHARIINKDVENVKINENSIVENKPMLQFSYSIRQAYVVGEITKSLLHLLSALERLIKHAEGLGTNDPRDKLCKSVSNLSEKLKSSNFPTLKDTIQIIWSIATNTKELNERILTVNYDPEVKEKILNALLSVESTLVGPQASDEMNICNAISGLVKILDKIARRAIFTSSDKRDIDIKNDILDDLEVAKEYLERVKNSNQNIKTFYLMLRLHVNRRWIAEKLLLAKALRDNGYGIKRACRLSNISTRTWYKYEGLLKTFGTVELTAVLEISNGWSENFVKKVNRRLRKLERKVKSNTRKINLLADEFENGHLPNEWQELSNWDKLRKLLLSLGISNDKADCIVAVFQSQPSYYNNSTLKALLRDFDMDERKACMIADALFPPPPFPHPYSTSPYWSGWP
jgi:hypothetical protein